MTATTTTLGLKGPTAYSITQLSIELGLTQRALRFYEQKKLIKPARNGQRRAYTERDRLRVIEIQRGKALGFTIHQIKEMLTDGGATGPWLEVSKAQALKQLDVMRAQLDDTQRAISALQELAAA